MDDLKRYQPRRSSPALPWRRWLLGVAIIIVLVLIGQAIFGRGGSSTSQTKNSNQAEITLVNDNTNTSTAPLNGNSTISSAPVVAESWANFSVSSCRGAIGTASVTKKIVALTFELAAASDQAKQVVSYLQQNKIPASFFSSGTFAEANPDFVKSVATAGFAVYNRGHKTVDMTTLSKEDIVASLSSTDQRISDATGQSTKPIFRPPYGSVSDGLVTTAKDEGYCVITWTVDGLDWQNGVTADQVTQRVVDKLQAGAIIDLHAGYDVTLAVVMSIVGQLKTKGYTPVSLATLLQS